MDFEKVTHLDLGCSPASLRIEDLLRQGVENCAGIDRDLSSMNEDHMALKWAWGLMKDEHPDEYAQWNMHDGPQVFVSKEVKDRLVSGNAIDVLRMFGREQIHVVYGDHFFHELDPYARRWVRDELDRVMRPNGVIIGTMHEGEEEEDFLKMFKDGYEVCDRSNNYALVTNDQVYWKAIEGINNQTCVQITLAKCDTAAR